MVNARMSRRPGDLRPLAIRPQKMLILGNQHLFNSERGLQPHIGLALAARAERRQRHASPHDADRRDLVFAVLDLHPKCHVAAGGTAGVGSAQAFSLRPRTRAL